MAMVLIMELDLLSHRMNLSQEDGTFPTVSLFPSLFPPMKGWGLGKDETLTSSLSLSLSAILSLPTHPYSLTPAPCGGAVHNATIGRVLSPSHSGNTNGSQVCMWTIEAPEGQKLHLHFERLSLHEKDR